jgi:hypothetical protein
VFRIVRPSRQRVPVLRFHNPAVAIDRINTAGQGTTGIWTGTWTNGWSAIHSLGILGQLLEYKAGDGTAAIDQRNRTGQGTAEIWRAIWNPGYTTVTPFSLPVGLPGRIALDFFAFCYNAAYGEVSIPRSAPIGNRRRRQPQTENGTDRYAPYTNCAAAPGSCRQPHSLEDDTLMRAQQRRRP